MHSRRFVSRITRQTQALILAGGRGSRLEMLTDWRAKPAVPFGGKFRIIDFALSNCLHSGIRRIGVLTQYKSHSLIRHLMLGWNSLNNDYGEFLELIPAQQWLEDESWYLGTADAVYQSLDIIESHNAEYILVLAGDHVYKMDYGELIATHVENNADITVACHDVSIEEAHQFGVAQLGDGGRIVGFEEKPADPKPWPASSDRALASLGIYVFSRHYLHRVLEADAQDENSEHDFGHNIIPGAITRNERVFGALLNDASPSTPYWRDVGTLDAYYQTNMELLERHPSLNIFDPQWPIFTNLIQAPPAKFINHVPMGECRLIDSMVADGAVIADALLDHSIVFAGVSVGEGCQIKRSLILPDCQLGANCRVRNAILDNGCILPPGTVVGEDSKEDRQRFHVTDNGVVVINRAMLGQPVGYQPALTTPGTD